jgi:hypothetical protein
VSLVSEGAIHPDLKRADRNSGQADPLEVIDLLGGAPEELVKVDGVAQLTLDQRAPLAQSTLDMGEV